MLSTPGKVAGLGSLDVPTFQLCGSDPCQASFIDELNFSSLLRFKSPIKKENKSRPSQVPPRTINAP